MFKPLYNMENSTKISSVYVATIDGESGVFIRNFLQSRMRYMGNPKYRLEVSFSLSQSNLAIARDNSVARKQIRANMKYTLYQLQTATTEFKKIYDFESFGTANFSVSSGPYISEVSERDARRRALTIASENGILRLASYLYE